MLIKLTWCSDGCWCDPTRGLLPGESCGKLSPDLIDWWRELGLEPSEWWWWRWCDPWSDPIECRCRRDLFPWTLQSAAETTPSLKKSFGRSPRRGGFHLREPSYSFLGARPDCPATYLCSNKCILGGRGAGGAGGRSSSSSSIRFCSWWGVLKSTKPTPPTAPTSGCWCFVERSIGASNKDTAAGTSGTGCVALGTVRSAAGSLLTSPALPTDRV